MDMCCNVFENMMAQNFDFRKQTLDEHFDQTNNLQEIMNQISGDAASESKLRPQLKWSIY